MKRAAIAAVELYRRYVSPCFPPMCRYTPTCSQYMIDAIRKKGVAAGMFLGFWRIVRCNPLSRGGHDPVE